MAQPFRELVDLGHPPHNWGNRYTWGEFSQSGTRCAPRTTRPLRSRVSFGLSWRAYETVVGEGLNVSTSFDNRESSIDKVVN